MSGGWKRYAAPAAFLLAVTIAVVLIRSGLESGGGKSPSTVPATTTSTRQTTTAQGTTTTTRRAPRRFYTVQAGDTFGVISKKTGVPVAAIQALNPNIASTSLHIGQRVRIK